MTEAIDAYVQYRQDIRQFVPQQWSHTDRDQDALVVENLGLVFPIARRYAAISTLSELDLIQEGNLGLMRAVQDYDPKYPFTGYAIEWIKSFIRHAVYRHSTSLTVPEYKVQQMHQFRRKQHANPDAPLSQIAEEMELSMQEAIELLTLTQGVASLNTPSREDDDEFTLADTLEANPDEYEPERIVLATHHPEIEMLLSHLLSLEQEVIRLRYGFGGKKPATHEEIARALRINRERVRSVEERAMMKLQRAARMSALRERTA